MNLKHAVIIVALLAVLCPAACWAASKDPIVYDPSIPPEECCTVLLAPSLTVKSFDGTEVNWRVKGFKNSVPILIPAGAHDFVLDYSRAADTQGSTHVAKGVQFHYEDFVAGHTYRMWGAEGAEPRGFGGMFKDITGSMMDTVQQKFTIMVKDVTK